MTGWAPIGESEIGWDEEELEQSELPIQWVPDGTWPPSLPPPPSEFWTPGQPAPLKRVTYHRDGPATANIAIVTADDQAFQVDHPSYVSDGRKEIHLDFGDASVQSARWWARKYLDEVYNARAGIEVELIPGVGPVPYLHFGIGDAVSIQGEPHRVVAIAMRLDASSVIQWKIDLDQPRLLLEERLASIMRRQLPGAAGGRTVLPTATVPSFPNQLAGREKAETWSANAEPGVVVLRKNGVAITGATATVGVGDTESVTLVDAERRYDEKVDKFDFTIDGVADFPELVLPEGRWIQALQITGSDNGVSIVVQYR